MRLTLFALAIFLYASPTPLEVRALTVSTLEYGEASSPSSPEEAAGQAALDSGDHPEDGLPPVGAMSLPAGADEHLTQERRAPSPEVVVDLLRPPEVAASPV